MKKIVTILAAVALLALCTSAFAADTATVNVSATVVGFCAFNPATPSVNLTFPTIVAADMPNAAALTATASVAVLCSNGVPWTISTGLAPGAYILSPLGASPDTISYTFNLTDVGAATSGVPLSGTGTGANQPITIGGSIGASTIPATITPDVYTQTVTLTLAP